MAQKKTSVNERLLTLELKLANIQKLIYVVLGAIAGQYGLNYKSEIVSGVINFWRIIFG